MSHNDILFSEKIPDRNNRKGNAAITGYRYRSCTVGPRSSVRKYPNTRVSGFHSINLRRIKSHPVNSRYSQIQIPGTNKYFNTGRFK